MSGTPDYMLDEMSPRQLHAHLHPEQARREAEQAEYEWKRREQAEQAATDAKWARIRAAEAEAEARRARLAGYESAATFRAAESGCVAVAEAIGRLGLWGERREAKARRLRLLRSEVGEALLSPLPGEEEVGSIAFCRARVLRDEATAWVDGGPLTEAVRAYLTRLGLGERT